MLGNGSIYLYSNAFNMIQQVSLTTETDILLMINVIHCKHCIQIIYCGIPFLSNINMY